MKSFSKWFSALAALVLLAGPAVAGDAIAAGRVKGIHADKKEFADSIAPARSGRSSSATPSSSTVAAKENQVAERRRPGQRVLRQGTPDPDGSLHSGPGRSRGGPLGLQGTVKSYDADKKELTFTGQASDWTFPMGDVKVRLNREDSKIGHIKIGDKALAIVEKIGEVTTLECLMIERK